MGAGTTCSKQEFRVKLSLQQRKSQIQHKWQRSSGERVEKCAQNWAPKTAFKMATNYQLAIFLHASFLSSRIRHWVFHISLMLRGHFRRWVDSSCGKSKVPFSTNMFLVRGIRAAPRKWWMDHGYPGMWMKGAWHLKDLNHEESFFGSTTH